MNDYADDETTEESPLNARTTLEAVGRCVRLLDAQGMPLGKEWADLLALFNCLVIAVNATMTPEQLDTPQPLLGGRTARSLF